MHSFSQIKIFIEMHNGVPFDTSSSQYCNLHVNEKITIGRNTKNNLVLNDPERIISRVQASLSLNDSASVFVNNLGSSAVMFINATEILPGKVGVMSFSDRLTIGSYILRLGSIANVESDLMQKSLLLGDLKGGAPQLIPEDIEFMRHDECLQDSVSKDVIGFSNSSGSVNELLREKAEVISPVELHNPDFKEANTQSLINDTLLYSELLGPNLFLLSDELPDSSILYPIGAEFGSDCSFSLAQSAKPCVDNSLVMPSNGSKLPNHSALSHIEEGEEYKGCRLALAQALKIDLHKLPAFTPDFFTQLGEILLQLTAGTVHMMHERAQIKHELRADVTIIAASANNPLKFAPDAQSAIAHLLGEPVPGFMRASDAINDAIDDLLAHQIGLLSGARAAVYDVVKNFSPEKIQRYLANKSFIDSFLPMSKKSKLWELYETHYIEVAGSAREEFELRFQQAFAQAYEKEIDRMCEARAEV